MNHKKQHNPHAGKRRVFQLYLKSTIITENLQQYPTRLSLFEYRQGYLTYTWVCFINFLKYLGVLYT
jgi:hypothetical protein